MKPSLLIAAVVATVASSWALSLTAQNSSPSDNRIGIDALDWPLEQVVTKNGDVYEGFIVDPTSEDRLEFVRIYRPKGKRMHLVILPIDRSRITSIRQSTEDDRAFLRERIDGLVMHAAIEASAMEDVALTSDRRDGGEVWQHAGEWFALESTANEEMTRRCVVRLEQMFRAFQYVLPPNVSATDARLRFKVFDTKDQYYQYLREQQINIRNPAYYVAADNLIVAGGDVRRVADEFAKTLEAHKEILAEIEQKDRALRDQFGQLTRELEEGGVAPFERRRIVRATRLKWQQQKKALILKISVADRRNAAKLDEVADRMFRRLYHEAFHAYLDNYVYDGRDYEIPTWLNEGLAQVFAAGLLEADTLRIDAPAAIHLERLQADLAGDVPLPLGELLDADQRAFQISSDGTNNESSRYYLYSWGLAYYLTFEKSLLGTDSLNAYVSEPADGLAPQERFERLVGMPLAEFEQQWRREMMTLRSPSRPTESQPGANAAGR